MLVWVQKRATTWLLCNELFFRYNDIGRSPRRSRSLSVFSVGKFHASGFLAMEPAREKYPRNCRDRNDHDSLGDKGFVANCIFFQVSTKRECQDKQKQEVPQSTPKNCLLREVHIGPSLDIKLLSIFQCPLSPRIKFVKQLLCAQALLPVSATLFARHALLLLNNCLIN